MRFYVLLCLVVLGGRLSVGEVLDDDEDDDGLVEEEGEAAGEDSPPEVIKEKVMYERPVPLGKTFFHEPFDTRAEFIKRWVQSQAKKDDKPDEIAKYDGVWAVEEPLDSPITNDLSLILKSKAKHAAITAKLDQPFKFLDKPLIVQYEVRFINGQDCGGAYIKLLTSDDKLNLKKVTDKTPFTIMFGPDKCGNDHKLHFIFRHKNPITGEFEEKHAAKPKGDLNSYFSDKKTHLYTLMVRPDNTYEIKIDNKVISSGDLLSDMSPPVNPPKEIEDPNDSKPTDWDDREKIPDPEATKPEDWDEAAPSSIVDPSATKPDGWLDDEDVYIPDPQAVKPEDWDDDMDGEWEAPRVDNPLCTEAPGCGPWSPPTIPNPAYKGKWKAPMIDNPEYKGEWKPQIIDNPGYFEDKQPFKMVPIGALALELWSMSSEIVFDNFLVCDNESIVEEFTAITWELKAGQERAAQGGGGVWAAIKGSTEGRPWLWAVYAMVLLVPVVLLAVCLCPTSGPVKPEDIAAHKKKTDDPNPDIIPEEEEYGGEEEEEEGESEGMEEIEAEEDLGAQGDATGREEKKLSRAATPADGDDDADEGDQERSRSASASPQKSTSPRKRKPRKE